MFFHLLTVSPISCSSLNVELLIAVCLCNHNHITSIKLSSGAGTGRNTNFILGQHMDISFCTFLIYALKGYQVQGKYFGYFYCIFYLTFFSRKSINCFFPRLLFIALYMHLVICMVICSKHI